MSRASAFSRSSPGLSRDSQRPKASGVVVRPASPRLNRSPHTQGKEDITQPDERLASGLVYFSLSLRLLPQSADPNPHLGTLPSSSPCNPALLLPSSSQTSPSPQRPPSPPSRTPIRVAVGGSTALPEAEGRDPTGQRARMPAQKRRLASPPSKPRGDHAGANGTATASTGGGGGGGGGETQVVLGGRATKRVADPQPRRERGDDSDTEEEGGGGGGRADSNSESSMSDDEMDESEFIQVRLAEIRKEVQCPICLGIIRKTRTVMECLHRFCRDCIDKSMRLGNNECPACRTHCASRRSLRDDPNYDALITALYPDIDKYEEEELAFSEEERTRNKKIQETIEETFRRQSEAVGKKRSTPKTTATAFARKYRRNMRARGRGRTITPDIAPTGSDDEDEEEGNVNDVNKESSSADDHSPDLRQKSHSPDLRQKKGRKRPAARSSPARAMGSSDHGIEENVELVGGKEIVTTSPLRGEMLAWGKNGARSQTRHGSAGGSNGRVAKGGRVAKLVDHLRTTDEMDKEFNVYLVLLPLDGQKMPNMEKPYLSCRPTLSIQHLVQFIALQFSRQVEEIEIYIRLNHHNKSVATKESSTGEAKMQAFDGLERLREDTLLSELHPSFASGNGDLELLYASKTPN